MEVAANYTAKIIPHFSIKIWNTEHEINLLEIFAFIQLAVSDINHDLTNLKLTIQEKLGTYVSPLLIPDDAFLTVLQHAFLKLSGLLFPAKPAFLSVYRDISPVYMKQMPLGGSLCYYLLVAIRGD